MAASSGSPPPMPREPAWKRLGLKLKYAKDAPEPRSDELAKSAVTTETSTAGSTTTQATNDSPSPSKKRKTFDQPAIESENPVANALRASHGQSESQASLNEHDHGLRASSTTQSLNGEALTTNNTQPKLDEISEPGLASDTTDRPRRKSVTFSADTKQDNEGSSSVHERSASQEIDQDHVIQSPPTSKKAQKRKERGEDSTAPAATDSKPSRKQRKADKVAGEHIRQYIDYLQLFHTDRSSWKFNKNNQKGLLRDLFRTDRIPSQYDDAILDYITGLQGTAARQRVIESANGVLKGLAKKDGDFASGSDMESEEARRNAYSEALQRHIAKYEQAQLHRDEYDDLQLEDMQREIAEGKRAEAVLRALLEQELHSAPIPLPPESSRSSTTMKADTTSQTTPTATSQTSSSKSVSKRKRRKARTQGSSAESSSDSVSSESEGDYNPKRGPATVQDALRVRSSPPLKSSPQKVHPKKKIFDDDFLDKVFPKKQTYHDTAPKRKTTLHAKPRGFAYTHGTRADESESE